jgi:hypothetical protein
MTTPAATSSTHQHTRDIHLLKHIVFILIVFISGWAPVYIFSVINPSAVSFSLASLLLELLPVLSSFIMMVDLFLYNHELRHYLKEKIWKCFNLN